MIFIKHRTNTVGDLKDLNHEWGCEIDIRSDVSCHNALHLSHDPWNKGEDFEDWLKAYADKNMKGPLILNTKEDGLESKIIDLLTAQDIRNWFFLDTALPTLVSWATQKKYSQFAVRISKYEPIEQALALEGLVEWIWVDCFHATPLPINDIQRLRNSFKICLVSPELQRGSLQSIGDFADLLELADAVCTKDPEAWLSLQCKRCKKIQT